MWFSRGRFQFPRFAKKVCETLMPAGVLKVAELIAGLEGLGCTRTTGEDQTVCVMSDSFNTLGGAEDLQASGDLPEVEVVKVCDRSPGGVYEFHCGATRCRRCQLFVVPRS